MSGKDRETIIAEALRRCITETAKHAFECSATRNFERECDCGWYELKQEIVRVLGEPPSPGLAAEREEVVGRHSVGWAQGDNCYCKCGVLIECCDAAVLAEKLTELKAERDSLKARLTTEENAHVTTVAYWQSRAESAESEAARLREENERLHSLGQELSGIVADLKAAPALAEAAELSSLRTKNAELAAEIAAAMSVLAPNLPESGLEDAARQVKQAWLTEKGNADALEAANAELVGALEGVLPLVEARVAFLYHGTISDTEINYTDATSRLAAARSALSRAKETEK